MKPSASRNTVAASSKNPRRVASETKPRQTARLFTNGASQAVRLPKEFRMEGKEVRIWKEGERVVMEPIKDDWDEWWAVLKEFPKDFLIERDQPPMQERDWGVAEPGTAFYVPKRKAKKK